MPRKDLIIEDNYYFFFLDKYIKRNFDNFPSNIKIQDNDYTKMNENNKDIFFELGDDIGSITQNYFEGVFTWDFYINNKLEITFSDIDYRIIQPFMCDSLIDVQNRYKYIEQIYRNAVNVSEDMKDFAFGVLFENYYMHMKSEYVVCDEEQESSFSVEFRDIDSNELYTEPVCASLIKDKIDNKKLIVFNQFLN